MSSTYHLAALLLMITSLGATSIGAAAPSVTSPGASPGATSADLYSTWRWSKLGEAEGVISGASFVREGADGTIWAGTREGALWFDGYRFIRPPGPHYTVKWLLALGNGDVAFIVDGVLHIGGRDGFTAVDLPFRVFNLVTDELGELMLLSRTSDLYQLQDGDVQPLAPPAGVRREDVLNLQSDGQTVWLRVTDGAFRRQGNEWVRELQARELRYLTAGPAGRRYGAVELPIEDRGLWSWEPGGELSRVTGSVSDLIRVIAGAADGRLLVVQESGAILWKDNTQDGIKQLDLLPAALRDVHDAVFRRNGDLLLATAEGVWLHHMANTPWERWYTPDGGARNRIVEILPASNGDTWLGTDGGVEVRHADGSVSWLEEALGRDLRIVTGLAEDPEGGIWISSGAYWDGALRFVQGQWQFYGAEEGLDSHRIHRIHRDPEGRLWFLGLSTATGASRNSPAAIVTYHEGRFAPFPLEGPLATGRVHSFAQGTDGSLWFSGVGGIGRYTNGGWMFWTTDSGLRYGAVFVLAADPQGDTQGGCSSLTRTTDSAT